ncbi:MULTISPECIES: DinB family protein [Burkholderia]|uniref:DinB family protein n=1 Tax=Burkholderia TaxID=32008 RepID=UPI00158ED797|nr:DinB family protein [Burkholderia cepacia]MCA8053921.1 DinB family protein [Burkholderia cepacia]MCA8131774.1 DinB family protein [Burkholderia cepacia]MCA8159675.1 DinB family protein [Burkholderia cepacia]HEM7893867.1 DinB family protein [Burkholderia cepacia]HEM8512822.1 DinB family protein [Burkholderia cepacia]
MHSRFDRFRTTALGAQLEALIAQPERYVEFAALSRVGVAAIGAIQHEIALKFPEIETDTTARQFCGAMVADVMRRHGHDVVQARGRLGGTLFSYGAVFSAHPQLLPFAGVVAALAQLPDRLAAYAAHVPAALRTRRPGGTGFSLVEHACHLRDLDAVFAERIDTVRTLDLPVIASVDGTALAAQRDYLAQPLDAAVAAFRTGRAALCAVAAALDPAQLARCGLRDGIRRMSLDELVRELLDHDRTHVLELDELLAELALPPLPCPPAP